MERNISVPAFGGASLLAAFGIVCILTFSLLSLGTVQAEKRLSDSAISSVSAYYEADRAAEEIFARLRDAGSEVIFMPSNPMCRSVSPHIRQELFRNLAPGFIRLMEDGVVDAYAEAGRKTAEECGVPVCDCYGSWNAMHKHGIDTTALLSNQLNHPTREMHWMFAWELIHTMLHN